MHPGNFNEIHVCVIVLNLDREEALVVVNKVTDLPVIP